MPQMPPYGEFIFGHEYAGDVVAVGRTVDEFRVGDRVVVEAHMGCRRCENCIRGLYTACLNYGNLKRGHRANGFTTNRSEEHTSELQSQSNLVCRLLLEKKKKNNTQTNRSPHR